jgi:hypothetical protein
LNSLRKNDLHINITDGAALLERNGEEPSTGGLDWRMVGYWDTGRKLAVME